MSVPVPLKDPRLYVLWWLSIKGVYISEAGNLVEPESFRSRPEIFDSLWLDYVSQIKDYNAKEYIKAPKDRSTISIIPEQDMKKALDELIAREKSTHRAKSIKALACTGENLTHIESFLSAVTGKVDPLEVAAIAHWVWTVKRKMAGLDVIHHLMPILRGSQGSGKSTAARKLFEPIQNYKLDLNFDQMRDDRNAKAMGENYIAFLDELGGVERAEMSVIKRLLTAETIDYRPMKTNELIKVRQAVSFLGCTNIAVNELLNDRTGMRRFFELITLDRCDWVAINAIDFTGLWQGIDEKREQGYITPYLPQLTERQQELVTEDEITTFISDLDLRPTEDSGSIEVPFSVIYQMYRSWCDENGHKPQTSKWVGRKMTNRGMVAKQKKVVGKNLKVYQVHAAVKLPYAEGFPLRAVPKDV